MNTVTRSTLAAALVLWLAASAQASIAFDVQVGSVDGPGVVMDDAHHVDVTSTGGTVNFDVYALITNSTGVPAANDGFQDGRGYLQAGLPTGAGAVAGNDGPLGDMINPAMDFTFSANGSTGPVGSGAAALTATYADTNGNGYLDIGSLTSDPAHSLSPRAGAMFLNSQNGNSSEFEFFEFSISITSLGAGTTNVAFYNTGAGDAVLWEEAGVTTIFANGTVGASIPTILTSPGSSSGGGNTVPEPASLAIIAVGFAALVGRRRPKGVRPRQATLMSLTGFTPMKSHHIPIAAAAGVLLFAAGARASISYDVQVGSVDGPGVAMIDSHDVNVTGTGGTVNFNVYADINNGGAPAANDGFQTGRGYLQAGLPTGSGSVAGNNGPLGDMASPAMLFPFTANASDGPPGSGASINTATVADTNGNGFLDFGSIANVPTTSIIPRSGAEILNSQNGNSSDFEFFEFSMTITQLGAGTTDVTYYNSGGATGSSAVDTQWLESGTLEAPLEGGVILPSIPTILSSPSDSSGGGGLAIPEPASLGVLMLGSVALLMRKKSRGAAAV